MAGSRAGDILARSLALMAEDLPEDSREAYRVRLKAGESGYHVLRDMADAVERVHPEIRYWFRITG